MASVGLSPGSDVGHYATVRHDSCSSFSDKGKPALFRGVDPVKDQSYFLCRVPQSNFEKVKGAQGGVKTTCLNYENKTLGTTIAAGGSSTRWLLEGASTDHRSGSWLDECRSEGQLRNLLYWEARL